MESPRSIAALRDLGTWFFGVPWVTRNLALLCVLIHVVVLAVSTSASSVASRFCFAADAVVRELAVHRIVVSPLLHTGVLHLGFNMVTWTTNRLESTMGSQRFLNLVLVSVAVAATMQCVLAEVLALLPASWGLQPGCSVGLSGVCFTVMAVEAAHGGRTTRAVGPFVVPASVAPWVMLLVLQLLLPGHISFLGHLCGLLVGVLYNHGLLNWLFVADVPLLDGGGSPLSLLGWLKSSPASEADLETGVDAPPPPQAIGPVEDDTTREALRMLVGMGFDRNRALAAIRASGSMLGAMDVLTMPQ